jgi:spore coat protein U-like protein
MAIEHSAPWLGAAAAAIWLWPGQLNAATSEAARVPGVSTTVAAMCSTAVVPIIFGDYSGAVRDATATILLKCTETTLYTVGLDAGTGIGSTIDQRKMTSARGQLIYTLFIDSARTTAWGQTAGENTADGIGDGAAQPLTVYGRIPGGQYVAPGVYGDSIAVCITY